MTIAACHVSPEGVVLGADSTTTLLMPGTQSVCHFDHAQKIFEVGQPGACLGLVTWGLGQIGSLSHRSIAAELGAEVAASGQCTFQSIVDILVNIVLPEYRDSYEDQIQLAIELKNKYDCNTINPNEISDLNNLIRALSFGYCLGGRPPHVHACSAYSIEFSPLSEQPATSEIPTETPRFWGVPFFFERLLYGFDSDTISQILDSGHWNASEEVLFDIIDKNQLFTPSHLPIREAIDWIHTIIHTTIRSVKFARWQHICGGPIEIATITSDRPFRWVCHKRLDSAIITSQESIG